MLPFSPDLLSTCNTIFDNLLTHLDLLFPFPLVFLSLNFLISSLFYPSVVLKTLLLFILVHISLLACCFAPKCFILKKYIFNKGSKISYKKGLSPLVKLVRKV